MQVQEKDEDWDEESEASPRKKQPFFSRKAGTGNGTGPGSGSGPESACVPLIA